MEYKKILQRPDGVLYLVVPKHSEFSKGDYVKLIKVEQTEEDSD